MAIIGPRPERPDFVEEFLHRIPNYGDRLLVKPGITGLAQVSLPYDDDENAVIKKLALDLEYVRSGTIGVEWAIIMRTFRTMLTGFGAR